MSVSTQIARIQADRNTIRAKLVELGMATNTDNLDVLASAISGLANKGAVQIEVKEGETYTIPAGYHNGSGTVAGVAGGGNYSLQAKTVTPAKVQQAVTSDEGYYGLSGVTVEAIPDAYQDVTSVTAEAGNVLVGKIFVASDGTVVTGTMTNNGGVEKTLDVTTITYTIPKGYHDGTGTVEIALETKAVTPTKAKQEITPTAGKVLSKVTVNPIPAEYITTTDADAAAANILVDKTAYVDGVKVTGTMPNNGSAGVVLDVSSDDKMTYVIPEGYHDGTGEVSIVAEGKHITPTKEEQTFTPHSGLVFSRITVKPIPDAYQDVTEVDAVAADVLSGKKIVDATGAVLAGTMANNGAVKKTIDGLSETSYTIPAGYHNGSGTVSLTSDIEDQLAAI